jgi:hypothetical protein
MLAVVSIASLVAGGCSSFNRDWKAAAGTPDSASGIAGRWEGTWHSDANGHNDRLRCLLTASTNGTYAARFHAQYKRLFRFTFSYTVPLSVTNGPAPDTFRFQGSANLGWYAGGRYTYTGTASPTNFHSAYDSKYDHGTFQMTRPSLEQ